jgi:UDPglucose 6-dehydrogenase
MRLCVVGAGYVGLVTGACFAEAGNHVVCVDQDAQKIARLRQGVLPIYEPGLAPLVERNVQAGRMDFTTDLEAGVRHSAVVFLAVGTPAAEDGSSDLSYVDAAVAAIGRTMEDLREYRVIVMKSTVPVGTHVRITESLRSITEAPFDYVANPEFLKEGGAVEDFLRPHRVVVGTTSPRARAVMTELYEPFMRKSNRMLFMDPASAEMTKYAANAMLATRISFMNEISFLCEKVGADVELREVEMPIAQAVWRVNEAARERFAERVRRYFSGRSDPATLAVWGLAFKANTDDIRESPAVYCVQRFCAWGMRVNAYDPQAGQTARSVLGEQVRFCHNAYGTLKGSDALVVLTDWQEFRTPDFETIRTLLRRPVIFDGRNLYNPAKVREAGFEYHGIGRGACPLPEAASAGTSDYLI